MTSRSKLYVDKDGVKRGYYVYLHKARATSEVFYVGKGTGRRAWEVQNRNNFWKEKVDKLKDGWDVEIIREDLSELEAFDLEIKLVEKYGGCLSHGGKLTNIIPGGENPAPIELGIQFDDGGWFAAYDNARSFKNFPRNQQEALVGRLITELQDIPDKLEDLEEEAEDNDDEELAESVTFIDSEIRDLMDVSSDFLRRRLPWKNFALILEETCGNLESDISDIPKKHNRLKTLLKQAYESTHKLLLEIDSGNKNEAEMIANQKSSRARTVSLVESEPPSLPPHPRIDDF